MTPRHSRHSRGGRGHIGEGEGAEASGFDADGKIYSLDSRASSRIQRNKGNHLWGIYTTRWFVSPRHPSRPRSFQAAYGAPRRHSRACSGIQSVIIATSR